ncbi:MAG: hypothetical protein Q7R41_09695, partial [Phycisphaerales bacterium]|nr:hypothetical protein [Phycisphaerales bacterium]
MKRIVTVVTLFLAAGAAAALPGCEKEPAPPAKSADPSRRTVEPLKPAAPATTPQAEKAPPTMPANPTSGSPAAESAA